MLEHGDAQYECTNTYYNGSQGYLAGPETTVERTFIYDVMESLGNYTLIQCLIFYLQFRYRHKLFFRKLFLYFLYVS